LHDEQAPANWHMSRSVRFAAHCALFVQDDPQTVEQLYVQSSDDATHLSAEKLFSPVPWQL
jgi:hypothetical protein